MTPVASLFATACAAVACVLVLASCASPSPEPPIARLHISGSQRFELPEVLGTPILIAAPELPVGTLAEGESAEFDIEFSIDLRGSVAASKLVASSHPGIDAEILAQHRTWIYAVATRDNLCAMNRFRAVQQIRVTRREGKLSSTIEPARVLETIERVNQPSADTGQALNVPNFRTTLRSMEYPAAALREGVEGRLALLVVFAEDGTVSEVYPVNAAYDRWGFTRSAMRTARNLKADPPPGRRITACLPIDFRLR